MKYQRGVALLSAALILSSLFIGSGSIAHAVGGNSLKAKAKTASQRIEKQVENTRSLQQNSKVTMGAERQRYEEGKKKIEEKVKEGKKQVLEKARERILQHIDRVIEHLQTIQNRTKAIVGLSDAQKAQAIADIDNLISDLNGLKEQVSSTETTSDLRSINKQVRLTWHKAQAIRKKNVGLIVAGRFLHFVNRLEKVADRLETRLNTLAGKGVEVGDAQAKLQDFRKAIKQAKTDIDGAVGLFNGITANSDAQGAFRQGMSQLHTAKKELIKAGQALRGSLKDIRGSLKKSSTAVSP